MNNIAQLVECVHVVGESMLLIDELIGVEWEKPRQAIVPRPGTGVGAVEVPRGILYHCYEFDKNGRIVRCDCVIPTSQNHANIQHDLEELARQYAAARKKDRDIELLAQMLVRSYDPCISCSVH
jgi:coenzyme F420-reducing hydrogenase alpha subunit